MQLQIHESLYEFVFHMQDENMILYTQSNKKVATQFLCEYVKEKET